MATFSKGYTFGSTEQVTNAKLHALVDSATISGITNDDIDSAAAIATSKLAAIDGSRLSGLANIPSSSGVIPAANLTSVAQKGANSDITALTGLSTPLTIAQGGTAATSASAARTALGLAIGTDVLAPNGDGSALTGITAGDMSYANTRTATGLATFVFPANTSNTHTETITTNFTAKVVQCYFVAGNGGGALLGMWDGTTHSCLGNNGTTLTQGATSYWTIYVNNSGSASFVSARVNIQNVTSSSFDIRMLAYDAGDKQYSPTQQATVYCLWTAFR
jgi:hypothetical protein